MTTTPIDDRAARRALERLDGSLELGMIAVGLVWLGLVVTMAIVTLPTALTHVATAIWGVFVADVAIRLALATNRRGYLRDNWIVVVALVVPALRILRLGRFLCVRRAARAARGIHGARVAATSSGSSSEIHALLTAHNALGYVICSTLAVVLLGSAGMFWLERGAFESYGHALWSTAMLIMTVGTGAWPDSVGARVLSVVLAVYGFGVLGYATASLASWFIGRRQARGRATALIPRQQA